MENNVEYESVNLITDPLLNPVKSFYAGREQYLEKYFFILFYLTGLTGYLNGLNEYRDNGLMVILWGFLISFITAFIGIYIFGGLLKIMCNLLGGLGDFNDVKYAFVWSYMPMIILTPLNLLLAVIHMNVIPSLTNALYFNSVLAMIFSLVQVLILFLGLWILVNQIRILALVNDFSGFKATISFVLAFVAFIALSTAMLMMLRPFLGFLVPRF